MDEEFEYPTVHEQLNMMMRHLAEAVVWASKATSRYNKDDERATEALRMMVGALGEINGAKRWLEHAMEQAEHESREQAKGKTTGK